MFFLTLSHSSAWLGLATSEETWSSGTENLSNCSANHRFVGGSCIPAGFDVPPRPVTPPTFSGVLMGCMSSRQPLLPDCERATGETVSPSSPPALYLYLSPSFKLWHFRGSLLYQEDTPGKQELLEVGASQSTLEGQ